MNKAWKKNYFTRHILVDHVLVVIGQQNNLLSVLTKIFGRSEFVQVCNQAQVYNGRMCYAYHKSVILLNQVPIRAWIPDSFCDRCNVCRQCRSIPTTHCHATLQTPPLQKEHASPLRRCYKNSVVLVRKRTLPTERPQPAGEVSANF
jgi:hypothetical protein